MHEASDASKTDMVQALILSFWKITDHLLLGIQNFQPRWFPKAPCMHNREIKILPHLSLPGFTPQP